MEHIIYLDNSATTKPCKLAVEYINRSLCNCWGNPSSLHSFGLDAELELSASREKIAKYINARPDKIIFTSGGTEANNTAIFSVRDSRLKKIITTKIEHPSVLEPFKKLEALGFELVTIGTDKNGIIDLEELKTQLDDNTALVSVMLVNNEIGSIQPICEVAKLVRSLAPKALLHCDAVQAFGKIDINVKTLDVDFLTASAHKIHGPKGIGFLYCKKSVNLHPFVLGGGQERGLRSGTESVPLIAGFAGAVLELPKTKPQLENMYQLNRYAREKFLNTDFIKINSPDNALPYILNISVLGYRSETVLHFLESKNIFVSSGSACAKGEASYVLKSIGLDRKNADSALRLSFSRYTSKEEIDITLDALFQAVKCLRRSNI